MKWRAAWLKILQYYVIGAVNGGWSAYSSWSACTDSKYCLQGMKKRTRKCTSPPPANSGDDCVGLAEEVKNCPTDKCTSKNYFLFLNKSYSTFTIWFGVVESLLEGREKVMNRWGIRSVFLFFYFGSLWDSFLRLFFFT